MEKDSNKKRMFISFEVTKELKEKIDRQAKLKKVNRSEYVRNALFEYMSK